MDNEEQKRLRVARRIIREFSEKFNKNITFEQDIIVFHDLEKKIPISKLIEANEQFQEELLEDSLPLVLFHMYEDLVIEQAKRYLSKKDKLAEFEYNILTYRPLPIAIVEDKENSTIQKKFSKELPFIIKKEGLYWVFGVQCGNKKGKMLLIKGHKFLPINKIGVNLPKKEAYEMFLESNNKWETIIYVGELGKKTGLYYAFGDRIADFLITQELFHKISQKTGITEIEYYTIVSRHFIIFSTTTTNPNRLNEIPKILHDAAEKDKYLKQIFAIKDDNDLIGKYHKPQKVSALPKIETKLNLNIKIDFSAGDLLAIL